MKNIYTFLVNSFGTNSYIYKDPNSNSTIIIDPGGEIGDIVSHIKNFNLKVEKIVLTHSHFDHTSSVEKIFDKYSVPIMIHKEEFDWLIDNEKNLSLFFGESVITKNNIDKFIFEKVDDKSTFLCGKQKILVYHTPGHTPGSISLFVEETNLSTVKHSRYLFCGDTLFCGSVGRTDFPGGNYSQLMKSIEKIFTLPEDTVILPGHGNHCVLKEEKKHNPFVK